MLLATRTRGPQRLCSNKTQGAAMDRKVTAYVSGTALDLSEYRKEAVEACLQLGITPVTYSVSDQDPLAFSFRALDNADIYIGIIGLLYGTIAEGQSSTPPSKLLASATQQQQQPGCGSACT